MLFNFFCFLLLFFFFFKQKTAYEIYQCDWSSDVCSSDLVRGKRWNRRWCRVWRVAPLTEPGSRNRQGSCPHAACGNRSSTRKARDRISPPASRTAPDQTPVACRPVRGPARPGSKYRFPLLCHHLFAAGNGCRCGLCPVRVCRSGPGTPVARPGICQYAHTVAE